MHVDPLRNQYKTQCHRGAPKLFVAMRPTQHLPPPLRRREAREDSHPCLKVSQWPGLSKMRLSQWSAPFVVSMGMTTAARRAPVQQRVRRAAVRCPPRAPATPSADCRIPPDSRQGCSRCVAALLSPAHRPPPSARGDGVAAAQRRARAPRRRAPPPPYGPTPLLRRVVPRPQGAGAVTHPIAPSPGLAARLRR